MKTSPLIESAKKAIQIELDAISKLYHTIDGEFERACHLMLNCKGRVVVIGMGKSGHIGRKIAATLASTGTPAIYVHPGEALHGDMGMITKQDVVLAISHSGTSDEVLMTLPSIKRMGTPLISMTGYPESPLAKAADVHLLVRVEKEACPLNLAPTASTTVALVMGDALAIALLETRGFTKEDFAQSHPAGRLGKRLLLQVKDIMHTGDAIPKINADAMLSKALIEMSQKSLGMTAIVDNQDYVIGIYTDGDLRRTLDKEVNVHQTKICNVMTKKFTAIKPDMLVSEALHLMETKNINGFLVLDDKRQLVGAFNLLDIVRSGII